MKWKQMEELIDTCLLAQMRRLVWSLSEKKEKDSYMAEVTRRSFYWEKNHVEQIEVEYGLCYPGEVLERYGEKIGDSIRTFRTLAVAMAEMKPLLLNSMFVENQYEKFVQKLRKEAQKDLICKGALFFLEENPEKKGKIRKALWEYLWDGVMELLFLMSIFGEEGWERWKNSLVAILGEQRKIEVYGNEDMYTWIIRQYETKVQGYRKKDLNLLKGLCRLPKENAQGKSPTKKWLMEAGYSEDEIFFLNWGVLKGTERSPQMCYPSITLERMAVQTCQRFLGSQEEYPQEIYELCTKLLKKNKTYEIKLEGEQGIFSTLKKDELEVQSVSAYMTLWPYREVYGESAQCFWIDLRDRKWDVLKDMFGMEMYRKKVMDTLVDKAYSPEEFADCVNRYEELTGETFLQYFWEKCAYPSVVLFQKMAEQNLIDTSAIADQYIQDYEELDREQWKEKWKHMFSNMKKVLFGLKNEKSYAAFQKIVHTFGIEKIDEFLREEDAFKEIITGNRYRSDYAEIKIFSDCFDASQNRQLFLWAEQYIYRKLPEGYPDFIYTALTMEKAAAILDKEVATEMAKYLLEHSSNLGLKKEKLRKLYWTEEEQKKYAEQKEKERKEKEQEKLRETKKNVEEDFHAFLQKMKGLDQLGKFIHSQPYWCEEFARQLIASYLKEYFRCHGFRIDASSAGSLMRLWITLYENGNIELGEVQQYVNSLEVEE